MTTPDTIEAYSFTEMREALDTEAAQREMIAQARAEGKAEGAREERERGAVFVDLDAGDGWIRIPIGEWEGRITAPSGRQGRDEGET